MKIFCLFLFPLLNLAQYSPLQFFNNPITIKKGSTSFNMAVSFGQLTDLSYLICLTQSSLSNLEEQMCQLKSGQNYFCFSVLKNGASSSVQFIEEKTIKIWELNTTKNDIIFLTASNLTSSQEYSHVTTNSEEVTIDLNTNVQQNKFYHIVSCQQYQSGQCKDFWKFNYLHTYSYASDVSNLIVQRFHHCKLYNGIYNHVFFGGTMRDQIRTMFFAALVTATAPFSMWGGFTYGTTHANKDMFCFSSGNGNWIDALSLLQRAPYQDTSINVGGSNDIKVISNSYNQGNPYNSYYFIEYYRRYNSEDSRGDDKLFTKINNHYTYAGYFHGENEVVECTNNNYKHQMYLKFSIDLSLFSALTLPFLLSAFFILMLI